QAAGGFRPHAPAFLERLRALCDAHDALLIFDEVATGFGRTGELFAADIYDAEPDIMALAKGMSSGYAPIGATLTAPDIGDVMSETAMSAYSTFGWVPSAVGAADANLDILQEDGLAAQAGETGRWMADRIRRIDGVSDVRQAGLVLGVQLTDATADAARSAALEHGLLVGTTNHDDVLLVAPPLNIDREYAGEGVERLADSIAACDA
ncbi:MAG: aminotransferase class III-fold pyridoxal phosphate-dependent enzyme, partial [Candidatus Nanohaloarchaea archaeon]|nr:aminotransferase class III-fold pyridoxal phosphate-dependent enzyme [Candidatus Nanohaloarchaea archaeon]